MSPLFRRAAALLCVALMACPPIQTGIVRARVVVREPGASALTPVAGASCALDGSEARQQTDADGRLRFSAATPGAHTVSCSAVIDGERPFGLFEEITLPAEAGHGGFVELGDLELLPIEPPGPVQASAGVRSAQLRWTPPSSSGGAPVTTYRISAVPGPVSLEVSGAQLEAQVTGLADDTAYTFEVAAVTLHGAGPAARSSEVRTPKSPSPPLSVRAAPSVNGARVFWWAPDDDGRSPLTGFTLTVAPGGATLSTGPELREALFTGLTPGVPYRFTVTAHNAVGASAASAESVPVTPLSAAEVIEVVTADRAGGCIAVDYRLTQATQHRADLRVEFDPDGDGQFERATQGGSATGEGVSGLPPGVHRFLWNSSRDLPFQNAAVQLRLSAVIDGVEGPAQLRSLTVTNGLSFAPPQVTSTVADAVTMASADFDGDGRPDVAVLSQSGDAVSVQLGGGDGTFKAGIPTAVGGSPSALAAGDLDDDGRMDLAVAHQGDDSVGILLGRGDGTFASVVPYAVAAAPVAVAIADLDRDGALDLVVAGSELSVLRGRGDGTFEAASSVATGAALSAVAVGDLDRDGALELVAAQPSEGAALVLRGNGDGTFAAPQSFAVGASPSSLTVADLDRDGHLDVLTANAGGDELAWLRGAASGALTPALPLALDGSPTAVTSGDLDGDGWVDLVAAIPSAQAIQILRGTANGFTGPLTVATGTASQQLLLSDLDRSGHVEVLSVSAAAAQLGVLRSTQVARCDVSLEASAVTPLPALARRMEVGDLDGDGRPDVVSLGDTEVMVSRGRGNGTFSPAFTRALGEGASDLLVADLDGDGVLDVAVSNPTASTVSLLGGVGDGTLGAPLIQAVSPAPVAIAAADLDGDGHLDLAVAGGESVRLLHTDVTLAVDASEALSALSLADVTGDGVLDVIAAGEALYIFAGAGGSPLRTALPKPHQGRLVVEDVDGDQIPDVIAAETVWGGNGDGTFRPLGAAPLISAAGDVDGDGRLELVGPSGVYRGAADGTFPLSEAMAPEVTALAVGDVDGDALPDVLRAAGAQLHGPSARTGSTLEVGPAAATALVDLDRDGDLDLIRAHDEISWQPGDGGGGLGASVLLAGATASALVSADFNADGRPDLAYAQPTSATVTVLWGGGEMGAPQRVSSDPRLLLSGDVDDDGALDLLVLSGSAAQLSVLLGDGAGAFTALSPVALPAVPGGALLADANRDGALDLIVSTSAGANLVQVLLGNRDGTFQDPLPFATGARPSALTAADFDGDGRLDLACALGTGLSASVLLGNGDGTFGAPASAVLGLDAAAITHGDVDGDGAPDLVAASPAGATVALGLGDGSFRAPRRYAAPGAGSALSLGDLDRDGRLDVVAGTVLRGR